MAPLLLLSSKPKCFRNSEVSQLEKFVGPDENILGLDISVDDVFLVQVLQRETNLHEPVPDLGLK